MRDGELLVEGTMMHVLVELSTLQKTAIPDWMREQLAPWTVAAA
jgi:acyl-CoA thioesterase FadM